MARCGGAVRRIEDFGRFVHTDTFGDVFNVFADDAGERHRKERLMRERPQTLEKLEHETSALRIVREIMRSGTRTMDFDESSRTANVFWGDTFRRMLGFRDENDFPNVPGSRSNPIHPEDKERVPTEYCDTVNDYTGSKSTMLCAAC